MLSREASPAVASRLSAGYGIPVGKHNRTPIAPNETPRMKYTYYRTRRVTVCNRTLIISSESTHLIHGSCCGTLSITITDCSRKIDVANKAPYITFSRHHPCRIAPRDPGGGFAHQTAHIRCA